MNRIALALATALSTAARHRAGIPQPKTQEVGTAPK
jgi:hypothetical protein